VNILTKLQVWALTERAEMYNGHIRTELLSCDYINIVNRNVALYFLPCMCQHKKLFYECEMSQEIG